MDKGNATWNYDECESIATLTFNLAINTQGFTTGSEYRISLTPFVSGSGYTAPVYHGSLQAFMSQSVNKPVYKTQNDGFVSHTSDNEYIIFTGGYTTPTTTTTIAPTTTTTTTIAPTTTTTTTAPTCFYTVGELVEGGVVAFASPSGAFVMSLENAGSGSLGCVGLEYVSGSISLNEIGGGGFNIQTILSICPSSEVANIVSNYTGSGYTDWVLGNRGEWEQIYNNRVILDANGANLGTDLYNAMNSNIYFNGTPIATPGFVTQVRNNASQFFIRANGIPIYTANTAHVGFCDLPMLIGALGPITNNFYSNNLMNHNYIAAFNLAETQLYETIVNNLQGQLETALGLAPGTRKKY
jgi:hypothetical protein